MRLKHFIPIYILFFLLSCSKEGEESIGGYSDDYELRIPKGFPFPNIPTNNTLTKSRVELGRKLFFDPILSEDSTISCASCHFPEKSFTDGKSLSVGVHGRLAERNAPNLANIAYHNSFFWDGGNHSLEIQVVGPIENVNEMNLPFSELINRLSNHPEYLKLFKKAYNLDAPNPFGITRAIAAFERTLISGNSPFDKHYYQGIQNQLSPSEINGMNLFFSNELKCSQCHTGFNFSNNQFENNGIYLNYIDSGRARITLHPDDAGKFKVPSLRNIELTAPYMHDGSFFTLGEVIDHYRTGGKNHYNQSALVNGFSITETEKQDLINFLKSLTDHDFVNNPNFKELN